MASSSSSSRPTSFLEVPSSFFDGARVFSIDGSSPSHGPADPWTQSPSSEVSSHQDTVPQGSLNRWACSTCSSLEFASLDEQRSHFKSDFHRLNVKRKLAGKEPVSEEEFEVLAQGQHQRDDDVSSISGSEEEDSDSSDEEGRFHAHSLPASKSSCYNNISMLLQSSNEIATFWKCVVLRDNEKLCKHEVTSSFGTGNFVTHDALLQRLKNFIMREGPEGKHLWLIVLSRGGHFAACVFDPKKGSILAHKTYHRYVVRAKAGGKQSTKDGTGRASKSAGASLRRHNEASLQREIRELLASWKGYLKAASCIFVHAPSRNSQVLFGGDDAPVNRSDERVCNVPITTRRPTFKEAKRIFNELLTITYQKVESIDVAHVANSSKLSSKKPSRGLIADAGHENLSEEANSVAEASSDCDKTLRESFSTLSSDIAPIDVKVEDTATPLHNAAKSGAVDLVLELLEKGADPCATDDRGRTPYTLATDKETRNAFRRFMATHLEMWDWHAANVPSALTDELEAAQAAKQAEKDAKRKAKAKEQKKSRKAKQKARESAAPAPNEVESSEKLKQDSHSTTVHDLKKKAEAIEREKRALAAEKRILAMSRGLVSSSNGASGSSNKQDGNSCSFCGVSLVGITPFYRLSFQYCTTVCVHAHRLALECQ
eukprot:c22301_g1_i1 orf=90-2060(+)